MAVVTIYTGPNCAACDTARQLLNRRHIRFEEIDIGTDAEARSKLIEAGRGRALVPQVFAAGAYVGDCRDLHELDEKGYLDLIVKEAEQAE